MKKKIAVAVWQKIQPLIDSYSKLFSPKKTDQLAFHLVDNDSESTFYFKSKLQDTNGNFNVEFYPFSIELLKIHEETVSLEGLVNYIKKWADVLKTYEDTPTFYDDHAQKKYEDYYFEEFKIINPEADYAPFDPPKVIYLEYHIEQVKEFVNENASVFKNSEIVKEINSDCDNLLEELTSSSQNTVVKKLAKIWAKISKNGAKLLKKLLSSFGQELQKKLIEGGAESFTDFLGELGKNSF